MNLINESEAVSQTSSISKKIRVAFCLPGLHRVRRGAEIALESIARELAKFEGVDVTLFGSGEKQEGEPYHFEHIGNIRREYFENFPRIPLLRSEYAYEELSFMPGLMQKYHPNNFDITLACSYPFVQWLLQFSGGKHRPTHIFITQNGDAAPRLNVREWRYFSCDGLVCTNLEYFERHKQNWFCKLITNGVNPNVFSPGRVNRTSFGLPEDVPLVLMVSALIESKRVAEGIKAASQVDGLHLLVCGNGPERETIKALGQQLMPGRFHLRQFPFEQMPDAYRLADAFLHMSMDEPFGNVYIEALATGLPIVAHDCTTTRWILENTSTLVDTTDSTKTAAGLREALQRRSPEQIEERRNLVEQRFTWQRIGQLYYEFITEVHQRHKAERSK
jgi:glycosyltransferase involved in cell wall biosynthesis